jgi:sugar lactone lactonase YvrE
MANNKSFKIKNGLDVGGSLQQTNGTITTTTYGYAFVGASYDDIYLDVQSGSVSSVGAAFKTDGTKLYIVNSSADTIIEYPLSTAWDITTAGTLATFSVTSEDTDPRSVAFKSDGTKMFVLGSTGNDVNQYTLSTAWDVTTASYDSVTFSISSQATTPEGLRFKPDGTKMFVLDNNNDGLHQYSLSTAWDLSTASYDSIYYDSGSQDSSPEGFDFNSDGTKLFILGQTNDIIYQYSLTTAYDVSTVSYDNVTLYVGDKNGIGQDIVFGDSGNKMFFLGGNQNFYQYSTKGYLETLDLSTGNFFSLTLSGPTTIAFSNPPASGLAQAIQLEITGNLATKYDISDLTLVSAVESDINNQGWGLQNGGFIGLHNAIATPSDLFFKPDGTKLYTLDKNSDDIDQHTLSTPWDLSTVTDDDNPLIGFETEDTNMEGMYIKPDGTKLFLIGRTSADIFAYDLSTAWDVSTATHNSESLDLTATETYPTSITFNPDGTRCFIIGRSSSPPHITQFDLTTAWDISTGTNIVSTDLDGISAPDGMFISQDDGKYLIAVYNKIFYRYTFGTAWDSTTISFDNYQEYLQYADGFGTGTGNFQGIYISPDHTYMYAIQPSGDMVFQFSLSSSSPVSWPSSIKWNNFEIGPAPQSSKKNVFSIFTIDGGTNYYGKLVGEKVE